MKKLSLLLLALALLLTGCGQKPDAHPEWDARWTRLGDLLALEGPAGFTLGEYNDALSPYGIWYVTWTAGEAYAVPAPDGETAEAYDAQLYFLLRQCSDEQQAAADVAGWIVKEQQNYETDALAPVSLGQESFSLFSLRTAGAENPYSHGAAAFGTHGALAISAELLCAEDYPGESEAILTQFLNGIHFGDGEA